MNKDTAIKLLESIKIHSIWDEEKWYFSVVDVISILTDQPHHQGARNYWKVLKSRLLKEGYSREWVNQLLKSIEIRKELTDEWDVRGVKKGQEYAILTDEITKAWSGLNIKQYRNPQRPEKGKPPRQHDQFRIGAEYAGRSIHY